MNLDLCLTLGESQSTASIPWYEDPRVIMDISAEDAVTETVSEEFAPSAVNTTTGEITLSMTGFVSTDSVGFGKFYFSSTGTLPAGITANTPYVGRNNGDGTFSFYPWRTDADWNLFSEDGTSSTESILVEGEAVPAGASLYYGIHKIIPTDQGTGTHTISTNPLMTALPSRVNSPLGFTETVRANMFEVLTDGNGFKYIDLPGGIAGFEPQGKLLYNSGKTGATWGALFGGKKYCAFINVMSVEKQNSLAGSKKAFTEAMVTAATGVITFSSVHGQSTGTPAKLIAFNGSVLPTPSSALPSQLFIRARSTTAISFHPTYADAVADTNVVTFSDDGTGTNYVGFGEAYPYSQVRRTVIDGSDSVNDHEYSPTTYSYTCQLDLGSSTYFMTPAWGNGNLNFVLGNYVKAVRYLKVRIIIPKGAYGPVCQDTDAPLESGEYYFTMQNWEGRFHRTLENAQAAWFKPVAACSNTEVIKYKLNGGSTDIIRGSGIAYVEVVDEFFLRNFDDGFGPSSSKLMAPYEELAIFTNMVDYNGGTNWIVSASKNGQGADFWNLYDAAASTRDGSLTGGANSKIAIDNSPQPHTSACAKLYRTLMIVSDTDPTDLLKSAHTALADTYNITLTPAPTPLPFTLSGCDMFFNPALTDTITKVGNDVRVIEDPRDNGVRAVQYTAGTFLQSGTDTINGNNCFVSADNGNYLIPTGVTWTGSAGLLGFIVDIADAATSFAMVGNSDATSLVPVCADGSSTTTLMNGATFGYMEVNGVQVTPANRNEIFDAIKNVGTAVVIFNDITFTVAPSRIYGVNASGYGLTGKAGPMIKSRGGAASASELASVRSFLMTWAGVT